MERNLEERLAHQLGREISDRVGISEKIPKETQFTNPIANIKRPPIEDIGEFPSLIQQVNTVPVLVVPRLEEGTSDYMVCMMMMMMIMLLLVMMWTD